jgi:predicted amidohydrolase
MRIHLFQYDIAWEDRQANVETVRRLSAGVDAARGDLFLLPEMFDSGFSLDVERTADEEGASAGFLQDLARSRHVYVQATLTVRIDSGEARNRAMIFDPSGQEIVWYDKIHPFSYGRESERFGGGDRVETWRWAPPEGVADAPERGLLVTPATCYDLRFPELFRAGLRLGAEMFTLGANWPDARQAHWRALLLARAIENQAFVAGVNRVGADPHLSYAGGSIIVGPQGEILGEAGDDETVLSAPIDPESARAWRRTFPAWRDMRPGLAPGVTGRGGFQGPASPAQATESVATPGGRSGSL